MLHGISLDKLELVVNLNFIQRIKSLIVTLVVTSSNKVELLGLWVLNTLEIMWEAAIVVWLNLDSLHCLQFKIQLVNIFGVLLQEMNHSDGASCILIPIHVEKRFAIRYHHRLSIAQACTSLAAYIG